MKPRVMILVIFTAFVGMMLAPDTILPINYFYVLLSISLGAGSSAAFNMWFDEDIDKSMERTKTRPIPLGVITKTEALFFGFLTGIISLLIMYYVSNTLATSLLLFTILFYVFIYTFWLKRSTSLNIVIGGAAGVAPFSMPYYRIYNPCPDSKSSLNVETKEANFIRYWVPELASFPSKYIFEPELAPLEIQKKSNCIIGEDYPKPIVDRKLTRKENLILFKESNKNLIKS